MTPSTQEFILLSAATSSDTSDPAIADPASLFTSLLVSFSFQPNESLLHFI